MVPLHQTEWCEMAEGRDLGMDAALILARTVHEDLTILSVVSWQHWLAVSCYDYRDGLVYVDKSTREYRIPKRMWALGTIPSLSIVAPAEYRCKVKMRISLFQPL